MKALIFQDKVVQISESEFPVAPGLTWLDCPEGCTTSWGYHDGVFTAPTTPTGPTLAERRATAIIGPMELADKLAALGAFDMVNTWANGQGGMIAYAWNRATQFERTHPLITDARVGLGWTEEQIDAIFGIE